METKTLCKITIKTDTDEFSVSAPRGTRLLDLLRQAGLSVSAPCGGNGTCGRCLVELDGCSVPACQTEVRGDCTVRLSELAGGAILSASFTAASSGAAPDRVPDRALSGPLGLAVDLGTTTVAAELLDLSDGKSLGASAVWNAQAPFGADVITRCQYCMEHPDGVRELQQVIRAQTARLCRELGVDPARLKETFVAGNTVMQHLYAGLSPVGISVAPFLPEVWFTGDEPQEPGLSYAPCVAGYVGGDITAGILASGLYSRDEISLFLDIGTNGEMALGGAGGFLGCAVASGPAFEGVGISCGMPGVDGAVSHVFRKDGDLGFEVIGNGSPKGICGSGLIDLLALLIEKRAVSGYGLLLGPDEAPEEFLPRLGEDRNGNGIFYLTEDRSVYLTAEDVRKLQLAKAAVAAGIQVLLKEAAVSAEQLDRLYLAGGFGTYMDIDSAVTVGMLPAALREKTVLLGNSSLAGARLALTDREKRAELFRIRDSFRYLELSANAEFNREYPEQMIFYEEDDDEWN